MDKSGLSKPLSYYSKTGFEKLSIVKRTSNIWSSISLTNGLDEGIEISSAMQDISSEDRLEMSYLVVTDAKVSVCNTATTFEIPEEFRGPFILKILVSSESAPLAGIDEILAESGLELCFAAERKILISASNMPYSVAIRADFIPHSPELEYLDDQYERASISA